MNHIHPPFGNIPDNCRAVAGKPAAGFAGIDDERAAFLNIDLVGMAVNNRVEIAAVDERLQIIGFVENANFLLCEGYGMRSSENLIMEDI